VSANRNHKPITRRDNPRAPLLSGSSRLWGARRGHIILSLIIVLALGAACGKRRPPLPPVERVPQRTELLSGAQRGNQIILSWPAPQRNAPDASVQSIRRIDIYRLAERREAPLPLTEEEFAARSIVVGSIDFETLKNAGDTLTYADTLELAGQPTRLRYAVRYVNASGQRAGFSNFLLIEPAAKIAEPPTVTGSEITANAVTILWIPPVNLLGYNVYRVEKSQVEVGQSPINSVLVTGARFPDQTFRFGEEYHYVVRSVSLGTSGNQVESLNSNAIAVAPVDTFAPSAPGKPSIAPALGRLALFFPANTEPDIAGYNVFRATDPDLPQKAWTKLTPTLITKTTFQDETVESGKRYYYYIVAVDNAGNMSEPSPVESETAP
jgi:hypothetical protein